MAVQIIGVAELRARLAEVLNELRRRGGPLYLTQRGRARAVLLAEGEYRRLIEELEDLSDALEVLKSRERRARGLERTETFSSVRRRLLSRARVRR